MRYLILAIIGYENLMDMVDHIEKALGKKAEVEYMDIQPRDVKKHLADIEHTKYKLSYEPKISIKDGVPKFIQWYKKYHMRTRNKSSEVLLLNLKIIYKLKYKPF